MILTSPLLDSLYFSHNGPYRFKFTLGQCLHHWISAGCTFASCRCDCLLHAEREYERLLRHMLLTTFTDTLDHAPSEQVRHWRMANTKERSDRIGGRIIHATSRILTTQHRKRGGAAQCENACFLQLFSVAPRIASSPDSMCAC